MLLASEDQELMIIGLLFAGIDGGNGLNSGSNSIGSGEETNFQITSSSSSSSSGSSVSNGGAPFGNGNVFILVPTSSANSKTHDEIIYSIKKKKLRKMHILGGFDSSFDNNNIGGDSIQFPNTENIGSGNQNANDDLDESSFSNQFNSNSVDGSSSN